jgi:hypothetical protein
MFGIAVIDVPPACIRLARSALPCAPVIEDETVRRTRSGRQARPTLGSRNG